MPKLTIDGIEVEVPKGFSILQACEAAGVEVPRFCYHARLSIAGNCRMCLVEMEKAPKPVTACAFPAGDNMVVRTNTAQVRKAREGAIEFLLANHPLDCPICDQGGECDLQDQAYAYGRGGSRFREGPKRAVSNKNMGPLVRTVMTRCIHCTRCLRFTTEIAGVSQIGLLNRGEHAEISTYLEQALDTELSGNVVDLCPVGALTSAPYAYRARPWEVKKIETIDVSDAVGTNIRVDLRGSEVLRILPRLNEDVNEEWMADRGRYFFDGLKRQRLDRPFVKGEDGRFKAVSWAEALQTAAAKIAGTSGERVAAIAGDMPDAEALLMLKGLMAGIGTPHVDCRQDGAKLDASLRASYLFNATIAGIEDADALVVIGADPKREAPVLNARIRKRWIQGPLPAFLIGEARPQTWDYTHLGTGPEALQALAKGEGPAAEALKAAEKPLLILGQAALARPDGAQILALARQAAEKLGVVTEGWNGFSVLHLAASRVAGLDLGLVPGPGGRDVEGILEGAEAGLLEVVYLLAADEIDVARLGKAFVIYQGHHGDRAAHRADVILPGAAFTEKSGTWVNTEGRAQRGTAASLPPGEARQDWTILRALSELLGRPLPYDSLEAVREGLAAANPAFGQLDEVVPAEWGSFGTEGDVDAGRPFGTGIDNYYMTDPISRHSAIMASCVEVFGTPKKAAAE